MFRSIECRKAKIEVITTSNHIEGPITTQSFLKRGKTRTTKARVLSVFYLSG